MDNKQFFEYKLNDQQHNCKDLLQPKKANKRQLTLRLDCLRALVVGPLKERPSISQLL